MRAVLVVAILLCSGCKKDSPPDEGGGPPSTSSSPTEGPNKAAFEARRIFATICAACHGPNGKGDGQAAAALDPKPRNYTDPTWQASVTDDDIKKIILNGGQAMGKSASMPAQPQLQSQPEVLDELVKLIRGFSGKTSS